MGGDSEHYQIACGRYRQSVPLLMINALKERTFECHEVSPGSLQSQKLHPISAALHYHRIADDTEVLSIAHLSAVSQRCSMDNQDLLPITRRHGLSSLYFHHAHLFAVFAL